MFFAHRPHQYSYFVGYVSKARRSQFDSAYQKFAKIYGREPSPNDVFDVCPFNDNFKQIIRSFHIYENTKLKELEYSLQNQIKEFFHLVADFPVPSCGDGRAFYAIAENDQIVMQCDRSMEVYALDGSLQKTGITKLMSKRDFIERFANISSSAWPYHKQLIDSYKS